jgi:hypothetical protein
VASLTSNLNREQAQTAVSRLLLEKIRRDTYPSYTQMTLLEQTLPPRLYREYLDALLEKVISDNWPSTTMLRRIEQFVNRV